MTQLIDKNLVGLLKRNLTTKGPINFIDGQLVLSGQAPHLGGTEMVVLWVSVSDGSVRAQR